MPNDAITPFVFKSMSRELLTMFKATKLGNEQMDGRVALIAGAVMALDFRSQGTY
jgi:hypothetical protein